MLARNLYPVDYVCGIGFILNGLFYAGIGVFSAIDKPRYVQVIASATITAFASYFFAHIVTIALNATNEIPPLYHFETGATISGALLGAVFGYLLSPCVKQKNNPS